MDYESERTRRLGCWDGPTGLTPTIDDCTSNTATPDFTPSGAYCDFLIDIGFGKDCPKATREFWTKEIRANYPGDEGRQRMRMAAVNLRERDGLHGRLVDVRCPVLWLHGTSDVVYRYVPLCALLKRACVVADDNLLFLATVLRMRKKR